jgi:sarcosine oxidase
MNEHYDVAVIGLGSTGSATLYELAKRGASVIGIEQFEPGHNRGSSHGESRAIRLSYFEHPSYVPLLERARLQWLALDQNDDKDKIFIETGVLEAGYPGSKVIRASLDAARFHNLAVEEMDASEIQRRFPAFHLPKDWRGHFQPNGGLLRPELAIKRYVRLAERYGAAVLSKIKVDFIDHGDGSHVRLEVEGHSISANRVVVTAGAWMNELCRTSLPLKLSRQTVGWFEPKNQSLFQLGSFPVFLLAAEKRLYYGFPDFCGTGVKAAAHDTGRPLNRADDLRQEKEQADEKGIRGLFETYLPEGNGICRALLNCLYTNTDDGHFLIEHAKYDERIIIASACSGHGFKFAPVLGEILADLAESKTPIFPISGFSSDPVLRLPPTPHL